MKMPVFGFVFLLQALLSGWSQTALPSSAIQGQPVVDMARHYPFSSIGITWS